MNEPGGPDILEFINGPEDGAEFPLTERTVLIGSDASCAAQIRFDQHVLPVHAMLSPVADGYRVRRTDRAPVYVNGKRAGMVFSKLIRSGDLLQIGQTLLTVECSPEGLASRSRGIVSEGDLLWAGRQLTRVLIRFFRIVTYYPIRFFGKLTGSWINIAGLALLLYLFWPGFRYKVNWFARWGYYQLGYWLERLFQS